MLTDIVFPRNNENRFVELAERLGYGQLVFVYENALPKLSINTKIKIVQKKAKNFLAEGNEKARSYLEGSNIQLIYALEDKQKKDYLHQRASGLNQVLCKIAKEKNKTIGFSFSMILKSRGMERARIIGRIMQNIMLCRKYKVKIFIGSFAESPFEMRAPKDLQAFFQSIGMTGKEVGVLS